MEIQGAVETVELTEDSKGIFDKMFPKEQKETIEETVVEAVIEEQKPITDDVVVDETPVTETTIDEPIVTDDVPTDEEDRIGITPPAEVQKKEVAEPVVEKVVEKSTRTIPFPDDVLKMRYNAIQAGSDISEAEIKTLYNKEYENLSDLDLISYSIRTDSENKDLSQKAINAEIQRKISEIQKDLDLDEQDDQEIFNELIKKNANKIKRELEGRRTKLVDDFLKDVSVEVETEVDAPVEQTPEQLAKHREDMLASAMQSVNSHITSDFITIDDKDGPINIAIKDKTAIGELLIDPVNYITQRMVGSDGQIDFKKLARMVNYAENMDGHDNTVIKRGIAIGKKGLTSEIKNRQIINPREQSSSGNKNPFENMGEFVEAMKHAKY